jgi:Mn-dependent DtxR family transcriptional regulator
MSNMAIARRLGVSARTVTKAIEELRSEEGNSGQ